MLSYVLLVLIIIFVTMLWQTQAVSAPHLDGVTGYNLNIEFVFDNQSAISLQYPYFVEQAESLLTVTENLAAQQGWPMDSTDYGDLGILVTQIGHQINGQNQKYWQFYTNDEMPMVSVNNYLPKMSDNIKWKFQVSEF